ncbi:hypothetical protein PF004_g30120 [Phytophthora fragariae]|uniref:Retrotransposon gag domain-containing protein n=1 Tax=Phytophthora fragariae TaxID=53985 RepID=A0A6G0ME34_9STRA|nr:hypothetical protein PF004_g30120 [Phytophthora fragariae]
MEAVREAIARSSRGTAPAERKRRMSRGGLRDDSSGDDSQNAASKAEGGTTAARDASTISQAEDEDGLESMSWWDALAPGHQRALMKRFVMQPLAVAPPRDLSRITKKLNVDEFSGAHGESVEVWLAKVATAAERQEVLDGEDWAPQQLFYGATARLHGAAGNWFIGMNPRIAPADRTFGHLASLLREAFGDHTSIFKTELKLLERKQQPAERLHDFASSLRAIGFGHGEIDQGCYVEAFISGINNPNIEALVRTKSPQTLEDAARIAVRVGGDYGEGFRVQDWRIAERRFGEDRHYGSDDDKHRRLATLRMKQGSHDMPPVYTYRGEQQTTTTERGLTAAALGAIADAVIVRLAGRNLQTSDEVITATTLSVTKTAIAANTAEAEMRPAAVALAGRSGATELLSGAQHAMQAGRRT